MEASLLPSGALE